MADSPTQPTSGLDDDRATSELAADGAPSPRRRGRWHVASYGEQRICSRPGCGTKLSRYNEKSYCASHDAAEY